MGRRVDWVYFFVQKLLTSPAAISDARIGIDTLYIEHRLVNVAQLSDLLLDHFSFSVQSQIPAILGSVDALGNPTAFFRHISTGLRDAATEFVTVNPFKATGKGRKGVGEEMCN